jgi:hypothetical protein
MQLQAILNTLAFLRRWAQALGPYVLLEVLLPGGTLLALTLFLYRSGRLGIAARNPRQFLVMSISAIAKRP